MILCDQSRELRIGSCRDSVAVFQSTSPTVTRVFVMGYAASVFFIAALTLCWQT